MPKCWLVDGLGAKDADRAPAHSGYLVERWPLMVVPHAADISPDAWSDAPVVYDTQGPQPAPYLREKWNGQKLSLFLADVEGEWGRWNRQDRVELVRNCLRVFFRPYHTLLDAQRVAIAHMKEPRPPLVAGGTAFVTDRTWAQEVRVSGLDMGCFVVIRSPVEPGSDYVPELMAEKVVRHPANNFPVILDPKPDVLGAHGEPPLLSGSFLSEGGVDRFIWPVLARWRPEAGTEPPSLRRKEEALPSDLARACEITGVDEGLARELLTFLGQFSAAGESSSFIGEMAAELLATEIIMNHPPVPGGVPEGCSAANLLPPYVWEAMSRLDTGVLQEGRRDIWLFDHNEVIKLFHGGELQTRGETRNWAGAMQDWLRNEANRVNGGRPCWVRFRDIETLGMAPEATGKGTFGLREPDWRMLDEGARLVKAADRYRGQFPYQREKLIQVLAPLNGPPIQDERSTQG